MLSAYKNMKISKKLPLVIVGLVVFNAIITFGITQHLSKNSAMKAAESKLMSIKYAREQSVNDYLKTIQQDLMALSNQDYVRQALYDFKSGWALVEGDRKGILQNLYIEENPHPVGEKHKLDFARDQSIYSRVHAKYHPWFREFLEMRGYYDIFLIAPEGDLVYSVFKEADYATNMYSGQWKETDLANAFKAAKANAGKENLVFFDFKPYAPSNGVPASFIAAPVMNNGEFAGALIFQMPIDNLNAVSAPLKGMGESANMFLVGEDKLLRTKGTAENNDVILSQKVDILAVDLALSGEEGTILEFSKDLGKEILVSYMPIDFEGVRWAFIAEIDKKEMMADIVKMEFLILLATIGSLIFVALLSVLYANRLVKPITNMVSCMANLAGGNNRIDIPSLDRKDEIGEMAKAVEIFKINAQKVEQLQQEQEVLKARAEEEKKIAMQNLADDFDSRTRSVIEALSASASSMQSSATQMNNASRQTTNLAQTVAAAATQADANVQTVAAATEELTASSQEIAQQIASVASMANTASMEAASTSESVNELKVMADSIGDVVGAIRDIAEQTNLLALNATIEAARAGAAGKGFAVVADEVKKLANETGSKTEEISVRISAIQSAISSSVDAMGKIINSVQSINEATTSVSTAVEEQNAATSEIGRNVSEASTGTQQVSQNIVIVQETAVETGTASGTVLNAAEEIAQVSKSLEEQISRFLGEIRNSGNSKKAANEQKFADAAE